MDSDIPCRGKPLLTDFTSVPLLVPIFCRLPWNLWYIGVKQRLRPPWPSLHIWRAAHHVRRQSVREGRRKLGVVRRVRDGPSPGAPLPLGGEPRPTRTPPLAPWTGASQCPRPWGKTSQAGSAHAVGPHVRRTWWVGVALPPAPVHAHVWRTACPGMRKPRWVLPWWATAAGTVEVRPHLRLVRVAAHLMREPRLHPCKMHSVIK